jgi:hypothetical protein
MKTTISDLTLVFLNSTEETSVEELVTTKGI